MLHYEGLHLYVRGFCSRNKLIRIRIHIAPAVDRDKVHRRSMTDVDTDEVVQTFEDMRRSRDYEYIMCKLNSDESSLIVDKVSTILFFFRHFHIWDWRIEFSVFTFSVRSCSSSLRTPFSFIFFLIISLHLSFGLPVFRCPPTSISLLHIRISFSPHGLTSHLCLPYLHLLLFLHSSLLLFFIHDILNPLYSNHPSLLRCTFLQLISQLVLGPISFIGTKMSLLGTLSNAFSKYTKAQYRLLFRSLDLHHNWHGVRWYITVSPTFWNISPVSHVLRDVM